MQQKKKFQYEGKIAVDGGCNYEQGTRGIPVVAKRSKKGEMYCTGLKEGGQSVSALAINVVYTDTGDKGYQHGRGGREYSCVAYMR